MTKITSPHEGKKVSEQKSENKVASPHAIPPRTNGEKATGTESQGKKKVCPCHADRDDTSVAVCQDDKKYLVSHAARLTKMTGKPTSIKDALAGIIGQHRQGASA